MKSLKLAMTLTALMTLTACDYIEKRQFDHERADRTYRAAMDDYRAGRVKQAVEGLRKVCRENPANSSARFQLACLLQDFSKEYFDAACCYREYIMQQPDSDKAALAKARFAICEKEVAKMLATKYKLNEAQHSIDEVDELKAEIAKANATKEKLKKDFGDVMQRVNALKEENERIRKMVRSDEATETPAKDNGSAIAKELKAAKDLLDEEDAVELHDAGLNEAKAIVVEEEKSGIADDKPLIVQAADAKEKRDAAREAEKTKREKAEAEAAAAREKIPDTYVIQEGDTLMKLAIRFYGSKAAWKTIREANKATVSTDGKVKVGQRIVMPK